MKAHVVSPSPHPVFKVPATRACCKPREAAQKGLQEGTPTPQRDTGALNSYPHYHLLFQTTRGDLIQQRSLFKRLPLQQHPTDVHPLEGSLPSRPDPICLVSPSQSQRPAGPVPETDEPVTRALPSLWFKRLLSLSSSF